MPFNVDERVVYPVFGVGRITAVVKRNYGEPEAQLYYEVTGQSSTLWVPVDESSGRGLRRLTRADELEQFRTILLSPPAALSSDFRQRQKDVRDLLKRGTLKDICEVVRDLSARGWQKALVDYDAEALRKSMDSLCQEWAAALRVTAAEASDEISGLLEKARRALQA